MMSFDIDFFPSHTPSKDFIKKRLDNFKQTVLDPDCGFFSISPLEKLMVDCQKIHRKFQDRTTFVHIGIGGSALGTRMLVNAFGSGGTDFRFIDNIDPDAIHNDLSSLDYDNTLFYIVSKSGETAETMAALAIIATRLKEHGIPPSRFHNHLVCCTDSSSGTLLKLAGEYKLDTLSIPSNIGGRFSVLTPVALLPALFAHIKGNDFLSGAENIRPLLLQETNNPVLSTASFLTSLQETGIHQTVFMPYSSLLKEFSAWLVQLWAESLGKDGKGLTPIAAHGACDQHSQMQLFMDGPRDKCLFFLETKQFSHDFPLKNPFDFPLYKKISSHNLTDLMKAEFYGTLKALQNQNRPYIHLSFSEINEKEIGALILFFESLTVAMGDCLGVNPFNQPGVEAAKQYSFDFLEKKRYSLSKNK